jgi:hypothetical protein
MEMARIGEITVVQACIVLLSAMVDPLRTVVVFLCIYVARFRYDEILVLALIAGDLWDTAMSSENTTGKKLVYVLYHGIGTFIVMMYGLWWVKQRVDKREIERKKKKKKRKNKDNQLTNSNNNNETATTANNIDSSGMSYDIETDAVVVSYPIAAAAAAPEIPPSIVDAAASPENPSQPSSPPPQPQLPPTLPPLAAPSSTATFTERLQPPVDVSSDDEYEIS